MKLPRRQFPSLAAALPVLRASRGRKPTRPVRIVVGKNTHPGRVSLDDDGVEVCSAGLSNLHG
ncbi:MAG TPA: hypothetical protein VK850_16950 [Candidatus Binatia bacterium]|jgi:hypothetical protein|nr:hypothetical protein [Candidatus Binatia bacterium]